jgi:signal transduction histidine kinase
MIILNTAFTIAQLSGTFLLGVFWCLVLVLTSHVLINRRNNAYNWLLIAAIGATSSYTINWMANVMGFITNDYLFEIGIGLSNLIWAFGLVGIFYLLYGKPWSRRFWFITGYGVLLVSFMVTINLVMTANLLYVIRPFAVVINIDLLLLLYQATQKRMYAARWLFWLLLIPLGYECVFFFALATNNAYIPIDMNRWPPTHLGGVWVAAALLVLGTLYRYNQQMILEKKAEAEQLRRDKETLLHEQNATLEAEVAARTAQLQAANHTKDRLFAIVSHDLRSPVSAFRDSLTLLHQQTIAPADFSRLTHELTRSTDRLYTNLDNLLLWSMTQLDEIRTQPEPVETYWLVEEVIELASEVTRRKQITVLNEVEPELHALVDEYQLKTILRNLLDNAVKFSPAGSQVRMGGRVEAGECRLWVSDQGRGIAPERLATLLNQASPQRGTGGEQGMGLGLRLCQELTERNGGQLRIESQSQGGTTVWLSLPLVAVEPSVVM